MRSKAEVFSLYRALIRAGDASVLHSRPAVYDVRRRLRQAFNEYRYVDDEKEQDDLFERGENMKRLFKIAARRGGPEHKSIVNLCEMAFFDKLYARRPPHGNRRMKSYENQLHEESMNMYKRTLKMANEELRLGLR